MSDIGKRIAELRQVADNGKKISQAKFAERLGIGQTAVAAYEVGRSDPSERTIKDICREFNVNEMWLRDGKGEMFQPVDREFEIGALVGEAIQDKSLRGALIRTLARTESKDWEVIERILDNLLKEYQDGLDK